MPYHLVREHGTPQMTPQLIVEMFISLEEERRMRIEEDDTKKFRADFSIVPGSDQVAEMKKIVKRGRTASNLSTGRRKKYAKK